MSGSGRRNRAARSPGSCGGLGASCDWANERFTMDDGFQRAVTHAFVELYQPRARLSRQAAGQLGPQIPDRDQRPRGRDARGPGQVLAHPISARRRQRARQRRDDAARDDARRHGGRGAPQGQAVQSDRRQAGEAADHRAAGAGDRRRACRPRAGQRRGQDHARPRLQRFRGRQARRVQAGRDAQHVRCAGAARADLGRADPGGTDRPDRFEARDAGGRAARSGGRARIRSRTGSSPRPTATARAR